MKNKKQIISRLLWIGNIFLLIFCLAGCGTSGTGTSESGTEQQESSSAAPNYYHKGKIFLPQADGKVTAYGGLLQVMEEGDVTNIAVHPQHRLKGSGTRVTDQGYFMAAYTGSADKLLIQVEGSDNIPYRYYFDPDGKYNALPLTAGDGSYAVTAYENVGDNRYAVVFTKIVDVTLENEVLPFLYSNQYVNFDENTKTVALAKKLTKGKTEIEAVQEVYEYVIKNIVYDDEKAATVKSGYLPNVDDTLKTKKGICFDYAALMTAMLRSSGIPTRLDIGYATNIYHAWISTYLDEQGWVDNVIKFDGKNWTMMDPTFAAGGGEGIQDFITDSSNYNIEYIH